MAVPKKRTSVSRKGLRRSGQHHRLTRRYPSTCSNAECGELTLPHTVCPACGTYKWRQVFAVKAAQTEEESAGTAQE